MRRSRPKPARRPVTVSTTVLALLCAVAVAVGHAHDVVPVPVAKRISPASIVLLDPSGNPIPGGMGTDTKARVGDVLTFVTELTPVANNATQGGGGYLTEYVPPNTQVVGARLLDEDGKVVPPRRGGLYDYG